MSTQPALLSQAVRRLADWNALLTHALRSAEFEQSALEQRAMHEQHARSLEQQRTLDELDRIIREARQMTINDRPNDITHAETLINGSLGIKATTEAAAKQAERQLDERLAEDSVNRRINRAEKLARLAHVYEKPVKQVSSQRSRKTASSNQTSSTTSINSKSRPSRTLSSSYVSKNQLMDHQKKKMSVIRGNSLPEEVSDGTLAGCGNENALSALETILPSNVSINSRMPSQYQPMINRAVGEQRPRQIRPGMTDPDEFTKVARELSQFNDEINILMQDADRSKLEGLQDMCSEMQKYLAEFCLKCVETFPFWIWMPLRHLSAQDIYFLKLKTNHPVMILEYTDLDDVNELLGMLHEIQLSIFGKINRNRE